MKIKIDWKTCFRVGISVFVVFLCMHYWTTTASLIKTFLSAVLPLVIGAVIAYPLNILMEFYERHILKRTNNPKVYKLRNAICLVLTLVTLLLIIALVVALVVPQLTSCIKLLIEKIPGVIDKVVAFAAQFEIVPEDILGMLEGIDWKSKISEIISVATTGIGSAFDVVVSTVSSVVSGATSGILALIFAIYLLLSKDKLFEQTDRVIKHFIKKDIYDKGRYVLSVANDAFHKFIVGQCTEAVILGVLCAVGMLILRLPYAAMMGAVTAFTALIPVVGALIGGGIGCLLIFVESPTKALIFLIFIVILQQLEGDLIYPKVVGSSIGLPGIWVFVAVAVGSGMFGILGMMISVPIAATAYRLLGNEINGKTNLLSKNNKSSLGYLSYKKGNGCPPRV